MTIKEAVCEAKSSHTWSILPHDPTTVSVRYIAKDGTLQKTDFDLYADDPETELADLWERLCSELGSGRDAVKSVEAYGFIPE